MKNSIVLYNSAHQMNMAALRRQRRILFSVHVIAFALFSVFQVLLFPMDWVSLGLRSLLMVTVIAHFSWLFMTSVEVGVVAAEWIPIEITPPALPLLPDGKPATQQRFSQHDFWYRWHDLG